MVSLFPLHLSACLFVLIQRQYSKFHNSQIFCRNLCDPRKGLWTAKNEKYIFIENNMAA